MRIPSIIAFLGFILLLAGTWCPLLRPFNLFKMDVYQLNFTYGLVLLLIAVIGILGVGLNHAKLVRITAWASLTLVVLLFVAAFLKVNTSFSFVPFKSLASLLSKQIKFVWGWYVLFAGPILALTGSLLKPSEYSR
jgi:hypothetical protein